VKDVGDVAQAKYGEFLAYNTSYTTESPGCCYLCAIKPQMVFHMSGRSLGKYRSR
jgi:hypothetical protein